MWQLLATTPSLQIVLTHRNLSNRAVVQIAMCQSTVSMLLYHVRQLCCISHTCEDVAITRLTS